MPTKCIYSDTHFYLLPPATLKTYGLTKFPLKLQLKTSI